MKLTTLFEMDERFRELERAFRAEPGDKALMRKYLYALIRSGGTPDEELITFILSAHEEFLYQIVMHGRDNIVSHVPLEDRGDSQPGSARRFRTDLGGWFLKMWSDPSLATVREMPSPMDYQFNEHDLAQMRVLCGMAHLVAIFLEVFRTHKSPSRSQATSWFDTSAARRKVALQHLTRGMGISAGGIGGTPGVLELSEIVNILQGAE